MLKIRSFVIQELLKQAESGYPEEICGLLVGLSEGNQRFALGLYQTQNIAKDRLHDRYEIDPKEYLKVEQRARELGLEIIGVYHSHPDHPDSPSKYDLERAFEGFSYLIVSVRQGRVESYKSWELVGNNFEQESIQVVE
ncbi:MAG: M67 family metallopeptidase [Aquificaceae bacterium]